MFSEDEVFSDFFVLINILLINYTIMILCKSMHKFNNVGEMRL